MAKPTLKQIWKYARTDLKPVPPGPYEVALQCAAAILGSGKFGDDMTAPMEVAWRCVFPFYQGQKIYLEHGAMMFQLAQHASASEGMTDAEAFAYVTGGETGDMGESGFDRFAMAVQSISAEDAAINQLRQIRISECDQAMFAADKDLAAAREKQHLHPSAANKSKVGYYKEIWDQAAAAQSDAHSWTPPADEVAAAVAKSAN